MRSETPSLAAWRAGGLKVLVAGVAAALSIPAPAQAGLVIELSGADKGSKVRSLMADGDRLTVRTDAGTRTLTLPAGTLPLAALWVERLSGGPLVFSIDGSLVSSDGDNFYPPSTPGPLARRLFAYDVFAHTIACGGTPDDFHRHPLVASQGGVQGLPHRRHSELLSPKSRSVEARTYRYLAARYIRPPVCVGELTMSVAFTGGPGLTRVQVRSWLHMITEQWYRAIDVPSHPDRWVARLPYRVLKEDIEGRWEAYREAFRPLDELTSTVEAVAVLHAVRSSGNGPTWSAFAGSLRRGSSRLAPTRAGRLRPHPFEDNPWTVLSRAWVGDRVETPAEANLALALILAGEAGGARNRWLEGVAEVARLDPRTQAKWRLYETLVDVLAPGRQSSGAKVKALFDLLRRDFPASFRLRAQALNLLEAMTQVRERAGGERTDVEPPRWLRAAVARLRVESRSLLKDFQRRTGEPCSGRAKLGTFAWEGLSQDVYSVGLLSRARGEEGVLDPELTAAVACIHRNRGLADQVGRELAHRHAHYRFLGYLRKKAGTGTAKDELVRFRKELAARVGVPSD